MDTESAEKCQAMLASFVETFGRAPTVIFTDKGAGIACAMRDLQVVGACLESTEHFLYSWHLSCTGSVKIVNQHSRIRSSGSNSCLHFGSWHGRVRLRSLIAMKPLRTTSGYNCINEC
jgi:hypothetical protein